MSGDVEKCAIITGIYGQDGSLLAERLLAEKYRVVGLVRKRKPNFPGLDAAHIIETDISDPTQMRAVFFDARPNECYHLAAAHHSSEQTPGIDIRAQMLSTNFLSTQAILDAILEAAPGCRFLYAGSSQMYMAQADITVVDETTPYRPSTYYGITKVASAQLVDLMRRERGLWGITAILFNHESTRRDVQYISRKVTRAAAGFCGFKNTESPVQADKLSVRDISARADWSAATDFVRAMHLSLQAESPADYVLASGKVHSVHDLLEEAFQAAALDWRKFVVVEQSPNAVPRACLRGNPEKARKNLGWQQEKSFSGLIREMVEHDVLALQSRTGKAVETTG